MSMANLLYLSAVIITAGCATEDRYLTLQEDQAIREKCAPHEQQGGCVVIPAPLFKQIIEALKGGRYAGS